MPKTAVAPYRPSRFGEASLEQAYEAFRLRCQAQNLAQATCECYDVTIRRWQRFLEERRVRRPKDVAPA